MVQSLFVQNAEGILRGLINPTSQPDGGTYHKTADKEPYIFDGYLDVPVIDVVKHYNAIKNGKE